MMIYTNRASLSKWDARFLELAEHVAAWSKGPRKRIGAVIVRPDKSIASLGYNGPPRGFDDEAFLRMTRDEQHSVEICPKCNGVRGFETGPNDWHDCDLCDATGAVRRND